MPWKISKNSHKIPKQFCRDYRFLSRRSCRLSRDRRQLSARTESLYKETSKKHILSGQHSVKMGLRSTSKPPNFCIFQTCLALKRAFQPGTRYVFSAFSGGKGLSLVRSLCTPWEALRNKDFTIQMCLRGWYQVRFFGLIFGHSWGIGGRPGWHLVRYLCETRKALHERHVWKTLTILESFYKKNRALAPWRDQFVICGLFLFDKLFLFKIPFPILQKCETRVGPEPAFRRAPDQVVSWKSSYRRHLKIHSKPKLTHVIIMVGSVSKTITGLLRDLLGMI